MTEAVPFRSGIREVEKDWIDYNGHLNMAYYNVLFDRSLDEIFEQFGMGPTYAAQRKLTAYTAEIHVCYVRELHAGDRVTATIQLLDRDSKRLHIYQELHHEDGWLSATSEVLTLHIDMAGPRVAPFPPDVMEKIERIYEAHGTLPRPDRAGRAIAIRRSSG